MINRSIQTVALVLALLFFQGCSALNAFEDALEEAGWAKVDRSDRASVRGRVELLAQSGQGWVQGLGAIVSDRHVWTVAHVVNGATTIEVSVEGRMVALDARVVRRIAAHPEPIVELEVELQPGFFGFAGFPEDQRYELGDGEPASLWGQSGLFSFPCETRAGDSGAPLLDADGRLVGLWVGRMGSAPVWLTVPPLAKPGSEADAPAQPSRDALPAPALLARASTPTGWTR